MGLDQHIIRNNRRFVTDILPIRRKNTIQSNQNLVLTNIRFGTKISPIPTNQSIH